MGDDRRKFNEQIIDTAARVSGVEERIAKTQERLAPLDFSEQRCASHCNSDELHCRSAGRICSASAASRLLP